MNKHYEAATLALDEGYKDSALKGEISRDVDKLLALIQIQATLALVEEQRTANLITLLAARVAVGDNRMLNDLDTEIEDKLDLA